MNTLSQKTSIAFFLFSALICTGGMSVLTEHTAHADSAVKSVSRTQIEEQFNRPTRRTRKKIEEARKLRLQRYSRKVPTIRTSTVLHTSAEICAKADVYNNPDVFAITKERLVKRVALRMNIDEALVIRMLKFPQTCVARKSAVRPDRSRQAHKPAPSTRRTYTTVVRQRPSVVRQRPSRNAGSAMTSTMTSTKISATVITVPETGTGIVLFPPEAKIRVLCRVQERGTTDRGYFNTNVQTIAQQFADKWNMNVAVIAEALIHPDLCNKEQSPFLATLLESSSMEVIEKPVVQKPVTEQDDDMFLDGLRTKVDKVLSLPKALLIVGTLAFVTFLILVSLLVAPLFQKKKD